MEPNDNLIWINFTLLHYMSEANNMDTQQKCRLSATFEFRKKVNASYLINEVGNFWPKARTITFLLIDLQEIGSYLFQHLAAAIININCNTKVSAIKPYFLRKTVQGSNNTYT
jgi:hypothetical protein